MTQADTFIDRALTDILEPGERELNRAFVVEAPGMAARLVLIGPLLSNFITRAYFAVATDRRLVLIETDYGIFGPELRLEGVESIALDSVEDVTLGGLLNNRSITLHFDDRRTRKFRIAPVSSLVTGQHRFWREVPRRLRAAR